MSPGKRRFFALIATTTFVSTALASPVAAQDVTADTIDEVMIQETYEFEKGTPGGSVVISDYQIPQQLNFFYISANVDTQVNAAAFDVLWDVSSDGKYIAEQAVSIPTIANGGVRIDAEPTAECPNRREGYEDLPGFEIDLAIKPGLKWSDGEPLDLNDMRYTWEWNMDPANVGLYAGTDGWNIIDRFDVAEDGLSATVHFCTAFTGYYGIFGKPMLPEHYMSQIPIADAATLSYPVGPGIENAPTSGAFKFASASPSTIELVRNDNWVSPYTGDPAYLDRVVYRFFDGSKDAMIAAFLAGELDYVTDLTQGDYASISGVDPSVGTAVIEPGWLYEHFDANQDGHPALADTNVRMALAHGIDKVELYETIFPGTPMPEEAPCSPVPPGLYFRTTEGLTCIEYDPAKSAELLDASGWVDSDGDGIRDKDGEKLSFLHCHTGAGYRQATGDYLASNFRDLGIELINTGAPETVYSGWNEAAPDALCNLTRGNHDTADLAWANGFDLFGNTYTVYHSKYIPSEENAGAGANYARLRNPEIDAVLDDLYGATDQFEAVQYAHKLQQLLTEVQSEVVLYYWSNVRGVNPRLANAHINPSTASDMWNIGDWFLKEQA
jgi:peptide/nickel transport system substrate-binding protein